jgi:hypothetical protein
MNFFRKTIISRIFCILMAVHIFNLSVDTKDAAPDCIAEDLSINDQETVVEIVLEKRIATRRKHPPAGNGSEEEYRQEAPSSASADDYQ